MQIKKFATEILILYFFNENDIMKVCSLIGDTKSFDRHLQAIGSLGGGNHFIEIDKDEEGNLYLIIHTGSRNLGKQVADYYQELANQLCNYNKNEYLESKNKLIQDYKELSNSKFYEKYNLNTIRRNTLTFLRCFHRSKSCKRRCKSRIQSRKRNRKRH